MHFLVTGASGFIGSAMVFQLLAAGHNVTALGRPGSAMPKGASPLWHELGGGALVLPAAVDGVLHLAQSRAYRAFPGDAGEMFRVNVVGTQELLEAAAAAQVSRFCLISTGSVYEPFAEPLTEDAPLAPSSYLGASKLAAECIARPFGAMFPLSVLRLFGPYGPGQVAKLIPDLIRRVRVGEAVTLPAAGGGMCFAPTYVDDICMLIGAALDQAWAGTYNVGSKEVVTIEETVELIGRLLGKEPVIVRNPAQKGPAPVVVPDLAKLSQRYDLGGFRSLTDGLQSTIAAEG